MLGTIFLYNFILLGSTLFIYLSEKERTAIGRFLCTTIAFLIVFLPAAFRYEIGIDYYSYSDIYNDIGKNIYTGHVEPLYYYLNLFLYKLNLPVEALFIIVAFLIYFFAFLSYPSQYKAAFHFMYLAIFYFNSFTFMRGNISIAIGLFAIMSYITQRNLLKFYLYLCIAALFHKAIILIGFIPLVNNTAIKKTLTKNNFLIIICLISLFFFKGQAIEKIIDSGIANLFGYQSYLTHSYFSQEVEFNSGLGILAKLILLFIPLFFVKKVEKYTPNSTPLIITIIACFIALTLSLALRIFNRIEEIYAIAYIFALYLIFSTPTIPFKRSIIFIFLLFWFLTYNLAIVRGPTDHTISCDGAKITPYVSIFNKEDSMRNAKITRTNQGCKAYLK